MIIYVDIDNTICITPKNILTGENLYMLSTPIQKNIDKINKLFDSGHTIVYWTARGSTTKCDWKELTIKQLLSWNVKYNRLESNNKPNFDLLIDDKTMRIEEI
jgi:hypothetical protein